MFLLEGSDLVGKTTLAKQLEKLFPTHVYQHLSKPPAGFDYFWGYIELASRYSIRDRFHYSEIIYSQKIGRTDRIDKETLRIINGYLRTLGCFTIVMTADEHVITSRWGREEMYSLNTVMNVNAAFMNAPSHWDIDLRIHNNVYDLEEIKTLYERRQRALDEKAANFLALRR